MSPEHSATAQSPVQPSAQRVSSVPSGRGRIAGIDALRGVAVGLVMLRHAAPDLAPGAGVVGVVMFFALSGHLITGVLLGELRRTGRLDLVRFYRRRLRRLVPALVVMLLGFTVVTWLVDPLEDRRLLPGTWLVALTWTANLPGRPESNEAAFHLWTLAGEEQFYLLWPLLLWWAWRRGRLGALMVVACLVALGALAGSRLWLGGTGPGAELAYALPTSWAIAFVLGGASAWWSTVEGASPRAPISTSLTLPRPASPARARVLGIVLAVATLALTALTPLRGQWSTYAVATPLIALATVVLVAQARHRAARGVPLGRGWTPLIGLGTVSYAAYLWNYPLALWLRPAGGGGPVLAVIATVLLAWASWRWIETPFAATGTARRVRRRESLRP